MRKMGRITTSYQQLFPDTWEEVTIPSGGSTVGTPQPSEVSGNKVLSGVASPDTIRKAEMNSQVRSGSQAGRMNLVVSKEARGRGPSLLPAGSFWFLRLHSCKG